MAKLKRMLAGIGRGDLSDTANARGKVMSTREAVSRHVFRRALISAGNGVMVNVLSSLISQRSSTIILSVWFIKVGGNAQGHSAAFFHAL